MMHQFKKCRKDVCVFTAGRGTIDRIGLGHDNEFMDLVGLDLTKWTHVRPTLPQI